MGIATVRPAVERRQVDDHLAAAWDNLADRAGAAPFARPGWLMPWADATGSRLEALATWEGTRLTGVLPIVQERHRLRTPADWQTPFLEAVADRAEAHRALAEALAATGRPRITIDFVLKGGPTATAATAALTAAGYRLAARPRLESPYVALQGSWDDYLGTLSTHRRRELRRRNRRLESGGAASFGVHDGKEGLPALLDEAFTVEAAGWKGEAGTAIASSPAHTRFYRRIATWAAERNWLRLAFLRLDGRPAAFDLALEAGGRHYLLKTGFDPAFAPLSPGLLLRLHMLERAFALGMESYEFCGAAEPWKLEWAPSTRPVLVIEAFAPTPGGSLARVAARAARFARVSLSRRGRRS